MRGWVRVSGCCELGLAALTYSPKRLCGLPISTYFSAVKLRWLLDNVSSVREEANAGACRSGCGDR